jgi:benzaldehyde dehydrogenase (NAD)
VDNGVLVATWDRKLFSGGWRGAGSTADVVSPSTGEKLASFGVASTADDSEAVGIATEAQQEWARVSGDDKARILRQGGDAIEAHTDVLAGWLGREAGSAHGKAAFEAGLVSAEFYLAAGTALMPYGQLLRSAKPRLSMAKRRPVGVVGVISPFNFPGILSARSIAPALALGNAVIH